MTASSDPKQQLVEGFIREFQRPDETFSEAVDRFADTIANRSPRTVWRWLSGNSTVPLEVIKEIRKHLKH